MCVRHGSLVVALVIVVSIVYVQQGLLAPQVTPVLFDTPQRFGLYIELSSNLTVAEVAQVININSSQDLLARIHNGTAKLLVQDYLQHHKLCSGQRIALSVDENEEMFVRVDFMGAERRIVLGVPLHPDQMSRSDWQVLPGVGKRMAQKIFDNQERYGYFYTFEALRRVSGVGAKTLERWRPFF